MSTNYPTALDDDDSMYNVTDNVDDVLAVHHNALKEAVIAIETALGITGDFNFLKPNADQTSTFTNTSLKMQWTADIGSGFHGGLELEAIGIFTGDLVHIHQHTGNPGAVTLVHIESTDTDVTPLKIVGTGTNSVEITGNVAVSGTVDGVDIAGRDHAPTVAGDLNHNDLANINAGDTYEHISQTQKDALHTKYALTEDFIANEITVMKAIDDASINNTKWDYLANMTEDPQTHMSAGNPHSSSASDSDLSGHASATATHGVAQVANHAEIASQISTHAALATGVHGVGGSTVASVADLHSEGHVLATSGPHTGELPLGDLAAGTSGDIIIRGASDWQVLGKADDSDVLTLSSGLPSWQPAGAPGAHALDSASHSDVSAITDAKGAMLWQAASGTWSRLTPPGTVGHMLVCDNVDGTISWQAVSLGDDLGDHTATETLKMGAHAIVGTDQQHRIFMDPAADEIRIYAGDTSTDHYLIITSPDNSAQSPMITGEAFEEGSIGRYAGGYRPMYDIRAKTMLDDDGVLGSYDAFDDLAIIDGFREWKKEGKTQMDKHGDVPLIDYNTIPDFLKDVFKMPDGTTKRKYVRPSNLAMFAMGAIKQLHGKHRDLEALILDAISQLNNRITLLEAN
jgi:hypothetical protein